MEREERRQKSQEGSSRREQAAARVAGAPAERKPLWKRVTSFLHDVRLEMKKVSWPTQQQMIAFTAVTVITTVALTLLVFALDIGLKQGVLIVLGGL
jgi:preprotein translocase subunit SecE